MFCFLFSGLLAIVIPTVVVFVLGAGLVIVVILICKRRGYVILDKKYRTIVIAGSPLLSSSASCKDFNISPLLKKLSTQNLLIMKTCSCKTIQFYYFWSYSPFFNFFQNSLPLKDERLHLM